MRWKYPDDWSAPSVILGFAIVAVLVGLFNVFAWFTSAQDLPGWWLCTPVLMVAGGVLGIVGYVVHRRRSRGAPTSGGDGSGEDPRWS